MHKHLKVLFLEDSEDDAALIIRQLEKDGFKLSFKRVDCEPDMRQALECQEWDAVISDYVMPGFDSRVGLQLLKEYGLDIPFIVVSGKIGEETAAAAMKAGANDYIMKNNLVRLAPALEREMEEALFRREKQEVERKMMELQKFEVIDKLHRQFLSNISHELRTPLATIKGFTSTLMAEDVQWNQEEIRDFVKTIDQEADRLAYMIDELMDLSSIESGTLKLNRVRCSVNAIIDSVKKELCSLTSQHTLKIKIPASIPTVYADCMQIGQVLVNLVDNATRSSAPGTSIRIAAAGSDDSVVVSVADEGEGIPQDLKEKIFDRFFQHTDNRKKRGAGLGLPVCKGIVEAHGGRIWVKSMPGKGSVFRFTLSKDGP